MRTAPLARRRPGSNDVVCSGCVNPLTDRIHVTSTVEGTPDYYVLWIADIWSADRDGIPHRYYIPFSLWRRVQLGMRADHHKKKEQAAGNSRERGRFYLGEESLPVLFTCPHCEARSMITWELLQGV